jgi:hypothetical protein
VRLQALLFLQFSYIGLNLNLLISQKLITQTIRIILASDALIVIAHSMNVRKVHLLLNALIADEMNAAVGMEQILQNRKTKIKLLTSQELMSYTNIT